MLVARSRARNNRSMKLYTRGQKPKVASRRLDRTNALKNIDYDASTSPSSSFDDQSAHRTRSLDILPLSDRTSFRIEGTEGEFDLICRSLGLSGPDDFAISTDDWEKRRSYSPPGGSVPSTSRFHHSNPLRESPENDFPVSFASKIGFSDDEVKTDGESLKSADDRDAARVLVTNGVINRADDVSVRRIAGSARVLENGGDGQTDKTRARHVESGIGIGIKGLRPPILAPPPAMHRMILDDMGSSWDLIKSFAPRDKEDLASDGDDQNDDTSEMMPSGSPVMARLISDDMGSNLDLISEDLGSDGPDDANVETIETMDSRIDAIASPSGSVTLGDKDRGSSSEADGEQYPLSANGSFRGGFENWQKGDFLGSGSFGTVYEGFNEMGHFFAVKEVSLLDQGSQGKQSIIQLEQEISLLSQFHHENIVQYLGTDTNDSKLYIFLELVTKGSLARLYQKYELRDSQVSSYTRQILSGLNYLHERKVVHRDIKCANILVDATGSVKLADFGLAKATTLNDIKSCKGTPYWMAPEVVNNRSNHGYGLAADIWSLGCTVLEMLTRKVPYSHLEGMQALFRIGRGQPPEIPDTLSREAQDFILQCLQVNPDDRPTAGQLLDHPFLRRRTSMNLALASPHYNATQL
ncbi:hypothetical protein SSX86_031505 [Deinandra increscens subsp. villosa]|uniref:mitogen-activated protein kinase kinase kinase n=1 Tax=Deinandra increscens subsp. villosa TaxID=3103831 RepID=A0AAP0C482_9ASTR